jgi:hypothetical protein
MKKVRFMVMFLFVVMLALPFSAHATLVSGESLTSYTIFAGNAPKINLGDGINLNTSWSIRSSNSVWFYGTQSTLTPNTDFYIYSGLNDPTIIEDASVFSYSTTPLWTSVNSTVFFRSLNGYYGAWVIKEIVASETDSSGHISVDWYYLNDGTSDFSVPEPATVLLLGLGGLFLRRRK